MSSTDYGYFPHSHQRTVKCTCGCTQFRAYPQAIVSNAPEWTFEYVCAKCGLGWGINVIREVKK